MTFSYSISSPATRDKVRLLIGDTNEVRHVFEDEELDTLNGLGAGTIFNTAALACRVIATDRAKQAMFVAIPGATITLSQIPAIFEARAAAYEAMDASNVDPTSADWYTETDVMLDAATGRANVELELPGVES